MDAIRVERLQHQRLALEALGLAPETPRVSAEQVALIGSDAAYLTLPIDWRSYAPLQDDSGLFYFVPDVSAPDGADEIQA